MSSNEHDDPAFPIMYETQFDSIGDYTHLAHAGLTARQYAAIHLRVPQSGIDWLDKMIKESNGGAVDLVGLNIEPDYLDGQWHDWRGGECPVPDDLKVTVEMRGYGVESGPAFEYSWKHGGGDGDIIRFRVVKP